VEFRHLRYFVAVAEEGGFTRAAQRLHMAQPPLSVQIRALEALLGVELFDRSRRAIRLTEAGQALLPEARRLLAERERAIAVVRRAGAGEVGRLDIGFIPSASNNALPPILRAFGRRYPDVELGLRELSPDVLVEGLRERRHDVVFIWSPFEDPELEQRVVAREPLVAALPAGHRLSAQDAIAVEDLAGEPFVLPERHELPGLYWHVVDVCREHGFVPRAAQSDVWLVQTLIGLVAAGVGVGLLPASVEHLHRTGVDYRPLRPAARELEMVALWRRGRVPPVLAAFLDALPRDAREGVTSRGDHAEQEPTMTDQHLDDAGIERRVDELEQERSALRRREGAAADHPERLAGIPERLEDIRVELDRLYDLRHQRRGLRSAGQDPDGASERDAGTVEGYLG
jgi:DNA-binding transcriptional LysR family regulator